LRLFFGAIIAAACVYDVLDGEGGAFEGGPLGYVFELMGSWGWGFGGVGEGIVWGGGGGGGACEYVDVLGQPALADFDGLEAGP